MAVVLANRARLMPKGTDPKALKDQKAGSVFGRLALTEAITGAQYDAGVYWLDSFLAYCRLKGVPMPTMLSTLASAGEIRGGADNAEEPEDRIAAVMRRNDAIEGALMDHYAQYHEAKNALVNVLVMDRTPGLVTLGALRAALNIIHKRCIMPERARP